MSAQPSIIAREPAGPSLNKGYFGPERNSTGIVTLKLITSSTSELSADTDVSGEDVDYEKYGATPQILLTQKGWDELCADIDSPPEPNEGLKRLFAHGKAWLESTRRA